MASRRLYHAPERPVEGLDGFGIQVLHGLFVTPTDAVVGPGVAIERVYRFCNPHL